MMTAGTNDLMIDGTQSLSRSRPFILNSHADWRQDLLAFLSVQQLTVNWEAAVRRMLRHF